MNENKRKKIWYQNINIQFVLGFFLLLIIGIGISAYMFEFGYLASGNDIWGHLFKSDVMYQSIKQGDWYPLYTKYWYNGIQPFRYWAPLPYYILALFQFLARGSVLHSYYIFVGFTFVAGGLGWLIWGRIAKRVPLGTVLGVLWFFLPENFRVFYCEGNIPRIVTTILVPYLVLMVWLYIKKNHKVALLGIVFVMMGMTLSHVMLSAMAGIGTFIFLLLYSIRKKCKRKSIHIIIMMLLSYLICGLWLIPALSGGLVGMNPEASASVMESLSYSLFTSLNPINRVTGVVDTFYYGIGIIIFSVIGILLGKKKERAGFVFAIFILLLTTTAAVPILSKLPLSQLLWMMRFATIAYGFFIWSIFEWNTLRRFYCIVFVAIIIVDCVPSMNIHKYYTQGADSINDEVTELKETTKQRTAIMDLSAYGSYPSFGLNEGENDTMYTYGWAWQGATTSSNIVQLNSALESENYIYLFDRAIELGNDTVLIRKDLVGKAGKTRTDLFSGAAMSGYELEKETNQGYIFSKKTPVEFGVVTRYQGIAIGKYANTIEMYYPSICSADSEYIDDYSLEELSMYSLIYLSGFEYHDKSKAESMLKQLGDKNIRVIIDMTHVPVDAKTKQMEFMDVSVHSMSLDTRYPTLYYKDKGIQTLDFASEYKEWNTAYIEGVKNVIGYFNYSSEKLPFIGTNENENVMFVGLNFLFHCTETYDLNGFMVINDLFRLTLNELPERSEVPIQVEYHSNSLVIKSQYDHVNTTLAALDTFSNNKGLNKKNNLLYVDKGTTIIEMQYPYYKERIIVSILGVFFTILFYCGVVCRKRKEKENA